MAAMPAPFPHHQHPPDSSSSPSPLAALHSPSSTSAQQQQQQHNQHHHQPQQPQQQQSPLISQHPHPPAPPHQHPAVISHTPSASSTSSTASTPQHHLQQQFAQSAAPMGINTTISSSSTAASLGPNASSIGSNSINLGLSTNTAAHNVILANTPGPSASASASASTSTLNQQQQQPEDASRASATLWMGDLEPWMDELFVRRCITALGWDIDHLNQRHAVTEIQIKMKRDPTSSSAYCFLTFPHPAHANAVLTRFSAAPPQLMPGSERVFKLNWATGLPGVQPRWEGEWSVFVADLARDVTEGDLVSLFATSFPSTKSAKVMYDPGTGVSRGYGFVRFGDPADMHRALATSSSTSNPSSSTSNTANNTDSPSIPSPPAAPLTLRGRTIRISEASGSGGLPRGRTVSSDTNHHHDRHHNHPHHSHHNTSAPNNSNNSNNSNNNHNIINNNNNNNSNSSIPNNNNNNNSNGSHLPHLNPMPSSSASNAAISPSSVATPVSSSNASSMNGLMSAASTLSSISSSISPTTMLDSSSLPPSNDPNNTTVFVGGLPACITEEVLKSYFIHFGEISYVKIPLNKGCGFVQFANRQDAQNAIVKMNDFPIHGKARIRLSWGRSQNDKHADLVKKVAGFLGIDVDAAKRLCQGQDNSTIKQIASALNTAASPTSTGPQDPLSPLVPFPTSQHPQQQQTQQQQDSPQSSIFMQQQQQQQQQQIHPNQSVSPHINDVLTSSLVDHDRPHSPVNTVNISNSSSFVSANQTTTSSSSSSSSSVVAATPTANSFSPWGQPHVNGAGNSATGSGGVSAPDSSSNGSAIIDEIGLSEHLQRSLPASTPTNSLPPPSSAAASNTTTIPTPHLHNSSTSSSVSSVSNITTSSQPHHHSFPVAPPSSSSLQRSLFDNSLDQPKRFDQYFSPDENAPSLAPAQLMNCSQQAMHSARNPISYANAAANLWDSSQIGGPGGPQQSSDEFDHLNPHNGSSSFAATGPSSSMDHASRPRSWERMIPNMNVALNQHHQSQRYPPPGAGPIHPSQQQQHQQQIRSVVGGPADFNDDDDEWFADVRQHTPLSNASSSVSLNNNNNPSNRAMRAWAAVSATAVGSKPENTRMSTSSPSSSTSSSSSRPFAFSFDLTKANGAGGGNGSANASAVSHSKSTPPPPLTSSAGVVNEAQAWTSFFGHDDSYSQRLMGARGGAGSDGSRNSNGSNSVPAMTLAAAYPHSATATVFRHADRSLLNSGNSDLWSPLGTSNGPPPPMSARSSSFNTGQSPLSPVFSNTSTTTTTTTRRPLGNGFTLSGASGGDGVLNGLVSPSSAMGGTPSVSLPSPSAMDADVPPFEPARLRRANVAVSTVGSSTIVVPSSSVPPEQQQRPVGSGVA